MTTYYLISVVSNVRQNRAIYVREDYQSAVDCYDVCKDNSWDVVANNNCTTMGAELIKVTSTKDDFGYDNDDEKIIRSIYYFKGSSGDPEVGTKEDI